MGGLDATIRLRRRQMGLSQGALAARVGVSQQTISRWESGGCVPPREALEALAGALTLDRRLLLRLAGYASAKEPTQAGELFAEIYARLGELGDPELVLLLDRAWREHRRRLGMSLPGDEDIPPSPVGRSPPDAAGQDSSAAGTPSRYGEGHGEQSGA